MNQRFLIEKYGIRAKKSKGQNFLTDPAVALKMVRAMNPEEGDFVLEIGAGLGSLTLLLAESMAEIVCVESDPKLAKALLQELAEKRDKISVLNKSILHFYIPFCFEEEAEGRKLVIGNLPFNITSPILFRLFEAWDRIDEAYLTVQKEVAQRLTAKPRTKDYGRLTVVGNFYAEYEVLFDIDRKAFFPKPEVTSSFVKVKFRDELPAHVPEKIFRDVAAAAFSRRRKKLSNSLANEVFLSLSKENAKLVLSKAGIDPNRRAEELSLEEFLRLTEVALPLVAPLGDKTD